MKPSVLALASFGWAALAWAQGPAVSPLRQVVPATLASTAEFAFQVEAEAANFFDPAQIRVDATVTGPGGRTWRVPAFWNQAVTMQRGVAENRFAGLTYLQFFVSAAEVPRGRPLEFAIADLRLVDRRSGRERALPELTNPAAWQVRPGATVAAGEPLEGQPTLMVRIVPEGEGYPGIHLVPAGNLADWSGYDTLRFKASARTVVGAVGLPVRLEVRQQQLKHTFGIFSASTGAGQGWQDCQWLFDRRLPAVSWSPPAAGEWRLRIAAPVAGRYTIALTATDRRGTTATQPTTFDLAATSEQGFIRVAPEDSRYLRYESGEPYFSIGANVLVFTDDFAEYVYYFDRFTAVGVNLFRVWLDNPRLGFEQDTLGRYEPRECAVLDELLNHAAQRQAHVMLCLLDFRELSKRANIANGGWELNPYREVCAEATDFFTNETAKSAFRQRLRYLVARWGASSVVQSWEFFNEVNLTDAWRIAGEADQVRAWHAEMAAFLRGIDPYGHLLTTSLSTAADDPLYAEPWIDLLQPHCYRTDAVDFSAAVGEPCRALARYGKPVAPGEFGLMTIKYQDVVDEGVSLHNGLWASVMSGCAGTAMPWWWEWIDRHDYYDRFRSVAEFVQGLRWHEQAFAPLPAESVAVEIAPRGPDAPLGPAVLKLERHTWEAAAVYNQPARITVHRDGSMTPPGALSTRLHGVGNHPDCHNPKTFLVDWPQTGRFVVSVGDVSGYGGANLRLRLDGEQALFADFVDPDETNHETLQGYRGQYAIDVPAGRHEIVIENSGRDWFTIDQIRLDRYAPPVDRLEVMGLRGRDTVLLWLRNQDYTWYHAAAGQPCLTIPPARLILHNVPAGRHTIRSYDPGTAAWLSQVDQAGAQGRLEISLPEIRHDLALMVRLGR